MAIPLINSSDFQRIVLPSDPSNGLGARQVLYTPPARGGAEYGADIKDFQVRVYLPSREAIDLDPVAFQDLGTLEARQALKEAIFDSGLGYLFLRIWRTLQGGTPVMLLDFPLYNSGLPSQVIQLASFWPDGVARLSYGSRLEFELIDTGSGGLVPGDYIHLWGTAIEEAWVPDPDVAGLVGAVQAQQVSLGTLVDGLETAIAQQNQLLAGLSGVVTNQNQLILAQRDLISKLGTVSPGGGGSGSTTTTEDTMHINLPVQNSNFPALPTPSDAVPATLGGFDTTANQTIVYYSPYDPNSFGVRAYEATYTLVQNGATLTYLPISRQSVQYYDGSEFQYFDTWTGSDWTQVGRG